MTLNDYLDTKIKYKNCNLWTTSLIYGVIVYLILVVLQPFGMTGAGDLIYAYAAPFGVVTFIGSIIPVYVIKFFKHNFFDSKNWTRRKEFFLYINISFYISIGNLITFVLVFGAPLTFALIWTAIWQTLAIGMCLISVGSFFLTPNTDGDSEKETAPLAASQTAIEEENTEESILENPKAALVGSGKNDNITFEINSLLYIESDKNYCNIVTDNSTQQIRVTMTSVEEQLKEYSNIVRCHRAYMVNRERVNNVEGNAAQGYRLTLDNGQVVPMARSYAGELQFVTNA